jgi:hypothetical protein
MHTSDSQRDTRNSQTARLGVCSHELEPLLARPERRVSSKEKFGRSQIDVFYGNARSVAKVLLDYA